MIKSISKELKVESVQEENGSITIKIANNPLNNIVPVILKEEIPDFEKDKIRQEEAAKMFDVTVQTIINWRKRGLIKSYKIGHPVYYRKSELLQAACNNSLLQKI